MVEGIPWNMFPFTMKGESLPKIFLDLKPNLNEEGTMLTSGLIREG
jgi:hypothetical protein